MIIFKIFRVFFFGKQIVFKNKNIKSRTATKNNVFSMKLSLEFAASNNNRIRLEGTPENIKKLLV